jgi:hypothetical protein
MEFSIHNQVLLGAFLVAVVMGAVVNKTNFCTMGAVSDWVNMGDTGRIRAWVFAMAVALLGVLGLEATGAIALGTDTFPPYRTHQFAWSRYIVGGLLFGVGMTLASGCGNKTLVRVGQGNLKSLVVLTIASGFAYLMAWTPFYETVFLPWTEPTTINLANYQVPSQELATVLASIAGLSSTPALHLIVGVLVALGMLAFALKSADFRGRFENVFGGGVVGLAIVAGWWITGGQWGTEWKEFATMSAEMPSRVATQSYTFMSPMGDTVRYLMEPTKLGFVNFGVVALVGVVVGSFS